MHENATFDVVAVTIDGFGTVEATPSHPFWTQRGWVPAEGLNEYDRLLDQDGHAVAVRAVTRESRDTATYNLSVDSDRTFFVLAGERAILVHNVDPWDILFTQSTYESFFTYEEFAGRTLASVAEEARKLRHLPPGFQIRAIRMGDGSWAALNNRTLAMARMANLQDVSPVDAGASGMNEFVKKLRESGLSGPVRDATMRCK